MDDNFYQLFVKAQTLDDRLKILLTNGLREVALNDIEETERKTAKKIAKKRGG